MGLEYVGYAKRGAIDWAGMAKTVSSKVDEIGAAREKAKAENEAAFQETNKLLNKSLDLEKQSLNQFVINGADEYKKMALDLKRKLHNREITSAEYKSILSNAQEHWVNFADQAKSADERFKLFQERSTPDANGIIAASDAENFLMEQYLDAADLNNKKMAIGKDGTMYLQKSDGSLIDYRDFARPENMQINKINLNEAVANVTSNWKSFQTWKDLGRGGEQNIKTIIDRPEYKDTKIQAVNAIVSNPKAALSVIVDNATTGGMYYMNDEDGKAKIAEAIAQAEVDKKAAGLPFTDEDRKNIEMSAIKFEKNSAGEFVPVLTEAQIAFAKETVDKAIDIQMEESITGSPRQPYSSSSDDSGKDADNNATMIAGYKASLRAFGFDPDSVKANPSNPKSWKTIPRDTGGLIGGYEYNVKGNTIEVTKPGDKNVLFTANNPKQLAQYIYGGTDIAKAQMKWEKARKMWLGDSSGGNNPKGTGELD